MGIEKHASWSPARRYQQLGIWGYSLIVCISSALFVVNPNFTDNLGHLYRYTYGPLALLFTVMLFKGYILEKRGEILSDEPKLGLFGVWLSVYFLTLPISYMIVGRNILSGYEVAAALLPIVPALLAIRAFLHSFRRADELFVKKASEAAVFSLLATVLTALTFGLLEENGLVRLPMVWILPIAIGYWSLGMILSNRRYE